MILATSYLKMQCNLKKNKNKKYMGQLHPGGSTGTAETSLSTLYLCEPFGTGVQIHHSQLKVIDVWLDTVIPSKPGNVFFNLKVFLRKEIQNSPCNDPPRKLEKGSSQPQLMMCGTYASYRAT